MSKGKLKLLIEWNDAQLSVGVETIDSQHKVLIDLINELNSAIEVGRQQYVIKGIFEQLYEYTQYHFTEEEQYFTSLNPAQVTLHKLQHKHFIEQLDYFRDSEDSIQTLSTDLLAFLLDWIISHILESDRKFIESNKREQ